VLKAADGLRPVIGITYSDRAGIGNPLLCLAAAEKARFPSPHTAPNVLLLELDRIFAVAFLELILDVLEEHNARPTKSHLRKSVIDAIRR